MFKGVLRKWAFCGKSSTVSFARFNRFVDFWVCSFLNTCCLLLQIFSEKMVKIHFEITTQTFSAPDEYFSATPALRVIRNTEYRLREILESFVKNKKSRQRKTYQRGRVPSLADRVPPPPRPPTPRGHLAASIGCIQVLLHALGASPHRFVLQPASGAVTMARIRRRRYCLTGGALVQCALLFSLGFASGVLAGRRWQIKAPMTRL